MLSGSGKYAAFRYTGGRKTCRRKQLPGGRCGRAIIYFTRQLPGITQELTASGLSVYEALALSEVFYLADLHPGAWIVIDHTVGEDAAGMVAQRYPTLRLRAGVTPGDVLLELPLVGCVSTIQ